MSAEPFRSGPLRCNAHTVNFSAFLGADFWCALTSGRSRGPRRGRDSAGRAVGLAGSKAALSRKHHEAGGAATLAKMGNHWEGAADGESPPRSRSRSHSPEPREVASLGCGGVAG